MPGSKEAYKKYEQTMIGRYGSLEAFKEKRREWARKGGKNSPGFEGMTPERRKEMGRKGYEEMIRRAKEQ